MFFPTSHKRKSNDYANSGILFIDDERNFTVDPKISFSHDKLEAKWDYFREDPLFHVFHSLIHQAIFINYTLIISLSTFSPIFHDQYGVSYEYPQVYNYTYPRSRDIERFYYMHDQIIRR